MKTHADLKAIKTYIQTIRNCFFFSLTDFTISRNFLDENFQTNLLN